jgi:tetratricopeptide (TPR) repeat protein
MEKAHGECLAEDILVEYLDGSLDPAIKAASEVHLIACDECRSRLGFFMRVLKEDLSAEEADSVKAISQQWDTGKRKLPRRTGTIPNWLLSFVGIAAVIVIAVAAVFMMTGRRLEPKSASEVVRLLLAEQRPFEAELADQPYRPIIRTRGEDDPAVAYGLVAGQLTKLSADSHQLGRFYLLQKDFGRAIPYLEVAEREGGAGAAAHNDLGVAYLESGGAHLDTAGVEFKHALEKDPAFLPAIFNLALFYERTKSPDQAAAEWRRYLQLDSNSDWGKEARSRLQGLSR